MPEEIREMRDPSQMHKAYNWCYAVAIPLYFTIGYSGMWAYGVFNSGAGLQLNWQYDAFIKWKNRVTVALSLLPLVYGQLVLFLKIELSLGLECFHPTGLQFPIQAPIAQARSLLQSLG